jgi:hypothetical protein
MFAYYHSRQAEQFTFYRIPRALFTDERFIGLSAESRILYGLMLDRMGLSRKNGWVDGKDRVYICFTLDEVTRYLHCGREKAVKLIAELVDIAMVRVFL